MKIESGYYVADCTSGQMPVFRRDAETFFLPVNIRKNEDVYEYEEYRFNLPMNYKFPEELLEHMANTLDKQRKMLQEAGVL